MKTKTTYRHLLAEPKPGYVLVDVLVLEEAYQGDGAKPEDYFINGTYTELFDYGMVTIESEFPLPDILEGS